MLGGSNFTIAQRYKFVESVDNFCMNFWHQLWKGLGKLFSDDRYVIWIILDMFSDSIFGLKKLDKFQLVEQKGLE
jgi:hypothetical protein